VAPTTTVDEEDVRTRGAACHREGTAPDGDFWQQQGMAMLARPRIVWHLHQPQELRNDTRALSGLVVLKSESHDCRRRAVQKLQSRTSFISDTPLSAAAAFTLTSRSLLAEDPPPSVLLRVASGALIAPSSRLPLCRPIDGCEATWQSQSLEARSYVVLPQRGRKRRSVHRGSSHPQMPNCRLLHAHSHRHVGECARTCLHQTAEGTDRQVGGKAGADKHRDLGLRRHAHASRPSG
jgi:hypothetical protein